MRFLSRLIAPVLATLLLGGCASFHQLPPTKPDVHGNLAKTRYQAELIAPDGVKVRFTVYQPALARKQSAPLIIHAHGFGLTRMQSTMDLYGKVLLTGLSAVDAWDRGYWVISLDQRGHGATGGKVGMLESDKEVADISRIIDWAEKNLALSRRDGDPLVGMIGESYGGAIQLLASAQDPRIDVVVPVTTWYDLEQALVPNGVPKSDWLIFLGAVGYGLNPFHMDSEIAGGVIKEVLINEKSPALRQRLARNSLSSQCGDGFGPQADALIIHGMRDVLFPANQGIAMRDCFAAAGRDVRFVAVEHGHLLPGAQWSPKLPAWHVDKNVQCGARNIYLRDMIGAWFDAKLRDRQVSEELVPRFCFTGDALVDSHGLPQATTPVDMAKVHVGSGMSGMFELVAKPMESMKNWFVRNGVREDWNEPRNGWLRPARVPLVTVNEPTWVAGIPRITVDIDENDRDQPILFLRMAVWTPGSGSYEVLNQQVTPVRGSGRVELDLAGVRVLLQPGQVLGVLAQGYSNQFRLAGSGWGTDASISGQILLPVVGEATAAR